ncbi:hypothetical protein [Faecalimonas umbilicata]|jgi:hypothetical protein|uniref:hypothetical protein n=1 Tax=Faecalimonas umbilicata TaxID=1912855 RepID=UPI0022E6C49A|nr:hypothetical protein [Faecalimonas umbilicata]
MAMICVFIDFTSFLIVAVASGNRKSRHSKIKSEVTALSIAGIRVPEMKKAPSHLYCVLHQIHIQLFKLGQTMSNCHRPKRGNKGLKSDPKTPPKIGSRLTTLGTT